LIPSLAAAWYVRQVGGGGTSLLGVIPMFFVVADNEGDQRA
jgi:hypothetical protein